MALRGDFSASTKEAGIFTPSSLRIRNQNPPKARVFGGYGKGRDAEKELFSVPVLLCNNQANKKYEHGNDQQRHSRAI